MEARPVGQQLTRIEDRPDPLLLDFQCQWGTYSVAEGGGKSRIGCEAGGGQNGDTGNYFGMVRLQYRKLLLELPHFGGLRFIKMWEVVKTSYGWDVLRSSEWGKFNRCCQSFTSYS
jgi:hypothetical protein